MLSWNVLSVSLLAGAGQALVLAGLLAGAPRNRTANRALAALIAAVALYMVPYIWRAPFGRSIRASPATPRPSGWIGRSRT